MPVLTDLDIRKRVEEASADSKLTISPLHDESLTPIGYDVRAGGLCASSHNGKLTILAPDQSILLRPNSTTLVTSLEEIRMPEDGSLSAFVFSKVSKVSRGLSHVSTTIDPDWKGRLVVALHNHSREKIQLKHGEAFCTVVFIENKTATTKTSGKVSGRNDVFIQSFAERNRFFIKNRKYATIFLLASAGLAVFGVLAWYFGGDPRVIAGTALAIAIITLIYNALDKK